MKCNGCCGGKYRLVKVILKIVIVVLIFWCGFKLGEMTGYIKAELGGRGNMRNYGMMRQYNPIEWQVVSTSTKGK